MNYLDNAITELFYLIFFLFLFFFIAHLFLAWLQKVIIKILKIREKKYKTNYDYFDKY